MTPNEDAPKPPEYENPTGYQTFDFNMNAVKRYCDSVTNAEAVKYLEWLKKEAEQAEAEEDEAILKTFGGFHPVRKIVSELNYRKGLLNKENDPQGHDSALKEAAPNGAGVNINKNRTLTKEKTKQPSRKIPFNDPKKLKVQWFGSVKKIREALRHLNKAPHYTIVSESRIREILASDGRGGRYENPSIRRTQIWVLDSALNKSSIWTTSKQARF